MMFRHENILSVFLLTAALVGSLLLAPVALTQNDNVRLSEDLLRIDQEIAKIRQEVIRLREQAASLEDQLFLIVRHIQQTELAIERMQKEQEQLLQEIAVLNVSLEERRKSVAAKKAAIALFLRELDSRDATPPLLLFLSAASLEGLFSEIAAVEQSQTKLLSTIAAVHEEAQRINQEKEALVAKQEEQQQLLLLAAFAREELRIQQFDRERLLLETRGSETRYQQLISERTKKAVAMRTTLYLLEDIGVALEFANAYAIAKPYAEATGVRPALLLAVLQKESHLGARVGTGYWQTDMHPRDWQAFLAITQELGLDPDRTPVSKKPSYGWGGAMGPAQFLPSTWLAWKEHIAKLSGNNPPSPWNIHDAFAAAALKLAAGGADQKIFDAEWKAAMIYFAGGNWDNPAFSFYGDSVLALAHLFEEQIQILEAAP